MRHPHERPVRALTLAALCVLSVSGCASPVAPGGANDVPAACQGVGLAPFRIEK